MYHDATISTNTSPMALLLQLVRKESTTFMTNTIDETTGLTRKSSSDAKLDLPIATCLMLGSYTHNANQIFITYGHEKDARTCHPHAEAAPPVGGHAVGAAGSGGDHCRGLLLRCRLPAAFGPAHRRHGTRVPWLENRGE
jgi:hypothetical protein